MELLHEEKSFDEEVFMSNMKTLSDWLEKPKTYLADVKREKKAYAVQCKMQEILDEQNIKTKVKIRACPLGMGDMIISFESEDIVIMSTAAFSAIIAEFDNFEIYQYGNRIKFSGVILNVARIV